MKSLKKLLCLLLALAVCLSLSITAFAEGEAEVDPPAAAPEKMEGPESLAANGTITIKNAVPTEIYKIYQIFYLESYVNANTNPPQPGDPTAPTDDLGNVTGGNYVYKINSAWQAFANRSDIKDHYLQIDPQGYVKWNGDATKERAGEFAKLALAYADENRIVPVALQEAPLTPQKNADGTDKKDDNGNPLYEATSTVTFDSLKLGYYLVDTSLGALCSLDTTNPNVTMQEKNSVPKNEKNVQEGGNWVFENDAMIGDSVNFKSFIEISSGTDHITFHDTMVEGLTFIAKPELLAIVLDATDTKATDKSTTLIPDTHYRVVTEQNPDGSLKPLADGCTFHIEFTDTFYALITTGNHNLTVTYSAILNENAVVGGAGNKNTSYVSYGDLDHRTPDSDTYTRTWDIPIFKFTLTGENSNIQTPLSGAIFKLSDQKEDPAAPISLINIGPKDIIVGKNQDGSAKTERWQCYRIATPAEIANKKTDENPDGIEIVTEITTDSSGKFRIQGLDSNTYYLHEVKAPDGFNKLSSSIPIQIESDGTLRQNESHASLITVLNGTGSELPSTGGIGTTIFYVVGSILLVGAGILLVTKRRMTR